MKTLGLTLTRKQIEQYAENINRSGPGVLRSMLHDESDFRWLTAKDPKTWWCPLLELAKVGDPDNRRVLEEDARARAVADKSGTSVEDLLRKHFDSFIKEKFAKVMEKAEGLKREE